MCINQNLYMSSIITFIRQHVLSPSLNITWHISRKCSRNSIGKKNCLFCTGRHLTISMIALGLGGGDLRCDGIHMTICVLANCRIHVAADPGPPAERHKRRTPYCDLDLDSELLESTKCRSKELKGRFKLLGRRKPATCLYKRYHHSSGMLSSWMPFGWCSTCECR